MTLDDIVRRNGLRYPNKLAFVIEGKELSWLELDQRVDRLCNALRASGLTSQDRIAILLDNCTEYFELYFACARAGLIVVPLNYKLTVTDLAQLMSHAEPAALIYAWKYKDKVADLSLDGVPVCWQLAGPSCDYEEHLQGASATPVHTSQDDGACLAIFYTSGTTGKPKGAMVSHRNLIANGFNQAIVDQSRREDINLVATPIYHMGAVFMAVTYMMLGCTQVILPLFTPQSWLHTASKRKVSVSLLIPTMINAVLNHPDIAKTNLELLRLVFYGGGPMHPSVLKRAIDQLGCGFTQGYGLTETLEATFLTMEDHVLSENDSQVKRLASAGREAIGAEVRIVDDLSKDLAIGEVGEILIRSESVISGYWRAEKETAAAIREDWFYTGDLGYLDEERYLFVVDRKKDVIISGGVNIYGKEVEERLYQHPSVLEAAVIGTPDTHWGEVVTAVIVLKPECGLTDEQVISHCGENLASFKKPKRVEFVDELPKNPSGKVLKRELRKQFGS